MRIKLLVSSCLIGVIILSVGYQSGVAKSNKDQGENADLKIGIVSVRKIFQDCKRNEKYRKQAEDEQEKIIKELQQLRAEIRAAEAGLEAITRGTTDYIELAQELAQKKAALPLKQEYYERQLSIKDQQWTEKLYKDVLEQTAQVAKAKALEMVFEKDTPEFPVNSINELMLTIRTNKLLYADGCVDITEEVMSRVDEIENN